MEARQNDKARVLGEQVQAPQALLRGPADPAITGTVLERGSLPAYQCDLGRAQGRDMPQGVAEQALEAQVVIGSDEAVPAPLLLRNWMARRSKLRPRADNASMQPKMAECQRNVCHPRGDGQSVQIVLVRSRTHPDHPKPTKNDSGQRP